MALNGDYLSLSIVGFGQGWMKKEYVLVEREVPGKTERPMICKMPVSSKEIVKHMLDYAGIVNVPQNIMDAMASVLEAHCQLIDAETLAYAWNKKIDSAS